MIILVAFGLGVLVGFIIGGFYFFYKGYTEGYFTRKERDYHKLYSGGWNER